MIGMLRRRGPLGIYSITYDLDNVSKQGTAAKVIGGESFQDTLSTDAVMISVIVKMGEKDITSSAYNPTTKAISIPFVNGDIVITAIASPVIVFADQNVKSLCVTNWGGNYLQGEITEWEAAQVTSLNGVFRGNTNITSFDELMYFTGLTSLYISGNSTAAVGEFNECSKLTSVKIPKANITNISGAFYNTKLTEIDLSPIQSSVGMHKALHNVTTLTKVVLPTSVATMVYTFRTCNHLTTLDATNGSDWSGVTSAVNGFNNTFNSCSALTTIIGSITGISVSIDFHWSPLTRASALVILNGLAQVQTSQKVTFKYSTYNLLTDADIAIATAKNWQVETIIEWEDDNLRDYILEQFPNNVGLTYSGQITNLELASITSLNNKFVMLDYFDEGQTKPFYTFNEFRFFTGLTGFSQYANAQGQFYNCTKLQSILLPTLNINGTLDLRALFRNCKALTMVDLSCFHASSYWVYYMFAIPSTQTGMLTEITLPSGLYGGGFGGGSYARAMFAYCRNLVTINIDGVADFSGIASYQSDDLTAKAFAYCSALTTINGTITGIKANVYFENSPLTHDTALMLINGLYDLTGGTQQTITFKASTYNTLTAEEIAIATNKGWQVASA